MDDGLDYVDFAVQRALKVQKHLCMNTDKNNIPSVLTFFDRCGFYQSLDRKRYEDAKSSFIFCGLIFEAYMLVIQRGEVIEPGTLYCLELSSQAVDSMVSVIKNPNNNSNLGNLWLKLRELQLDFKVTACEKLGAVFNKQLAAKIEMQLFYLEDIVKAVDKYYALS
ncbi:hypothetical protein ASPWEDRAFT_73422 [Aspergillus wentii DTO 134E9]|uniref:Uncharacterized protein n=1 Tax=Aspergillus wentii DTO 134E9 TaxID=1073089 RepID=A0A1L9R409_ASPWE|nr:uncharacterized protein ASPWEDRAFT_73422 [Aspergillus wentii DTO 134E9]KAI9923424.1 hypothetical protein MW887_009326 [Aspergillus wentii]OJJ29612.1 hypothetical protein ASPWEDRAFT_73422 [Aspergillus wentii DTO 134E9]